MEVVELKLCEFCYKEFTTISNFNRHLKKSSYCLKIQDMIKKKDDEIKKKDDEIKKTQAELAIFKELVQNPRTIIQNNYFAAPIFIEDRLKEEITNNYTLRNFINGVEGIVDFTVDKLLTDSNNTLSYKLINEETDEYVYTKPNNKTYSDVKGEKLFNKVVPLVHKKAKTFRSDNRISKKTYDQNFDEINDCLKNKNFEICNKKLKTLCGIHSNINDDDIIIEDSEN